MLAERTVRRLSIRAPTDALARRAGLLVEDALRTASLPGDGGGVLLLRRLRLPPFAAGASPQQVALRLEAVCREAIAVDGGLADDAALAAAEAVRFSDALTAHLALTRLILAGASRQAWCWPMLVKGYRPALGTGAALRMLALSLAELPEAPAALPRWIALVVRQGEGSAAALLLALDENDAAMLRHAGGGALKQALRSSSGPWRSLLDWSSGCLGVDDVRQRWLLDMAAVCGVDVDRHACREPDAAEASQALVEAVPAAPASNVGGHDKEASATGLDVARPSQAPASIGPPVTPPVDAHETGRSAVSPRSSAPQQASATQVAHDLRPAVAAADLPVAVPPAVSPKPSAPQRQVLRTATNGPADTIDELPANVDGSVAQIATGASTAAGGLLFLVPLLARLGLADLLSEDAARSVLPQRIFTILLLRLPVADDDPAWLLCAAPRTVDQQTDGEAARWLCRCRRYLRLQIGIGLHSLVCRPAGITITATHVDVRQAIDSVDLRVRRAGLDIDPGWVPWLGRVLRFHYGIERS